MWTAFPPSDYYADSATPRAHQPASGLAGLPPAARRARGASHVHHDPFDRVGSWLYPYSTSGGHSQPPAGHRARVKEPGAERAAVETERHRCCGRPMSARFGVVCGIEGASTTSSLSLYLSVSLARTRASGSAARPSRCRDASPPARDPAPWPSPASPGRCISPGPAFQPARTRC